MTKGRVEVVLFAGFHLRINLAFSRCSHLESGEKDCDIILKIVLTSYRDAVSKYWLCEQVFILTLWIYTHGQYYARGDGKTLFTYMIIIYHCDND